MNIKQILSPLSILVLTILTPIYALVGAVPTAQALSRAEEKACYEKWAGRSTGSAGTGKSYNANNFKKDKCSKNKKGSCEIRKYEDGSVIWCKKKNGTYANGSANWGAANPSNPDEDKDKNDDGGGESGGLSNPIEGDGCGGVQTAVIKCDADNSGNNMKNNGVWALLIIVLNILTAGVGIVAVGGIVYGAVLYTTAEDKADQVKKATDIITNVVIGLIAFALMWAGLNFIVPGGVFNG